MDADDIPSDGQEYPFHRIEKVIGKRKEDENGRLEIWVKWKQCEGCGHSCQSHISITRNDYESLKSRLSSKPRTSSDGVYGRRHPYHRIEKLLMERVRNGKLEFLVKWQPCEGCGDSCHTWVTSSLRPHWNEDDSIGGTYEKGLQSSPKRIRYDDLDVNRSSSRKNSDGNIIHNVTRNEIAGVDGRILGNQRSDDAKYKVCQGHKVKEVIGINLRGREPRMVVLYGDPEENHVRDIELVPCRIMRFYAPQKVISYYEGLLERTIRRP